MSIRLFTAYTQCKTAQSANEYLMAVRGVSRIWSSFTKARELNLRTVIVTAAVHRGFPSGREPL